MPGQNLAESLEFRTRKAHARGIVWRVEENQSGPLGDRVLDLFGRYLVIVLQSGGNDDRLAIAQLYDVRVGDPVRRQYDRFVARVQQRSTDVIEHLLGAGADGNFGGLEVKAVVALELVADGALKRRGAVGRGVSGVAGFHRFNRGGANVRGGVEVRFSGAQAEDVPPGRPHFPGQSGYGNRGRRLYALHSCGKLDGTH